MRDSRWAWFCAIVASWTLSACATNMHSDRQSVAIFTNPPDSNVLIDDVIHLQAPGAVTLSRKANHLAKIDKVSYVPTTIAIERT